MVLWGGVSKPLIGYGGEINNMKRFWNYLFYFTWKLHNIFWHNYVKNH